MAHAGGRAVSDLLMSIIVLGAIALGVLGWTYLIASGLHHVCRH
jgi:hypothetical protein